MELQRIKEQSLLEAKELLPILTRAVDVPDGLTVFKDRKKLQKIADLMPEIHRATKIFGRKNSQTTGKMMSLNMISHTPLRAMRQCLAMIEKKRGALKENIFKLQQLYLDVQILERDMDLLTLEGKKLGIERLKTIMDISDSWAYVEGALKEIAMYQDAYDQIRRNKGIPEDWDEADFEEMEIEEHVKTGIQHCVRDVLNVGRVNMGTCEYLEQFGMHPATIEALARQHVQTMRAAMTEDRMPTIEELYKFIDSTYEAFKDEHKKAMKRLGLTELLTKDVLYLTTNTKREGE